MSQSTMLVVVSPKRGYFQRFVGRTCTNIVQMDSESMSILGDYRFWLEHFRLTGQTGEQVEKVLA